MRSYTHQRGSTKPRINWDNEIQSFDNHLLAANLRQFVLYPWAMIDYHLYLTALERGRTCEIRLNETHLLTTDGFQQMTFDDLWDISTFDRVPRGTHPLLLFVCLPVPCSSGDLPHRKLVLGFDLKNHHLLAYLFDSAPDHIADLDEVWDDRQLVIDLDVYRFLDIMQYTVETRPEILRVGMFGYFQETSRGFQSGLDLVIAVEFVQFLDDFADLLEMDSDEFRFSYHPCAEKLRHLLAKASYDAWFGAHAGLTIQQYHQRQMDEFVLFELIREMPSTPAPASSVRHLHQGYVVVPSGAISRHLHIPVAMAVFVMCFFVSIVSQSRFHS